MKPNSLTPLSPEASSLIGQKVSLKVTNHIEHIGKRELKHTTYEIDDVQMLEKMNALGPNVRIFTPGIMGTMDYQIDRFNVYIDKEGVITRVSKG